MAMTYYQMPPSRHLWRKDGPGAPYKWHPETGAWVEDWPFMRWIMEATEVDELTEDQARVINPIAVATA